MRVHAHAFVKLLYMDFHDILCVGDQNIDSCCQNECESSYSKFLLC